MNPIETEIVDALDKIPTDMHLVLRNVSEWEKVGDASQMASLIFLMASKITSTEKNTERILNELQQQREAFQDVRFVTTTKLAEKLHRTPELREGFDRLYDDSGDVKLSYEGSILKADMYRGYDQLHFKLKKIYGLKEITYKTINNALLKSFNWSEQEFTDLDETSIVMAVLSKAEYLYLSCRKKKITIPEIKKGLYPLTVETKKIKTILLDAGWVTLKQGTCETLFFTQVQRTE